MPPKPAPKTAPTPQNHKIFDPWNTTSTGHQRADNAYASSSEWRGIRTEKLARQLHCDKPSPGSANTRNQSSPEGEWKWVSNSKAGRLEVGCRDIRSYMGVHKRRWCSTVEGNGSCQGGKEGGSGSGGGGGGDGKKARVRIETENEVEKKKGSSPGLELEEEGTGNNKPGVFAGTTIYVNGSTMPLISDHKLKQLLVSHGAKLAVSLLERGSVTHVIVGRPAAAGAGKGAGGGLAGGKLHKEIARRGRQVKVVYAEWALESIKASKRLSEANFALSIAPNGQPSVLGMFKR